MTQVPEERDASSLTTGQTSSIVDDLKNEKEEQVVVVRGGGGGGIGGGGYNNLNIDNNNNNNNNNNNINSNGNHSNNNNNNNINIDTSSPTITTETTIKTQEIDKKEEIPSHPSIEEEEENPSRHNINNNNNNNNNNKSIPQSSITAKAINEHLMVIPLDDRATPQLVAKKFAVYGHIEKMFAMKGSSAFIITFRSRKEAQICINALHGNDKVSVRPVNEGDWSSIGDELKVPVRKNENTVENPKKIETDKVREKEMEKSRRELIEMQENRINLMYQQKQIMQMVHEQDSMEWKKRETRYQLMEKRVESIFQTSAELQNYITTVVKLQKIYETGLHEQLRPFATLETGTVRQAAVAIESLQTNRHEQFDDMHQRVFQPAVESVGNFSNRLKNQLQYFKTTGNDVTNNLKQSRTNYESRWSNYEKALQERLAVKNKGEPVTIDPFLLGKEFDHVQKEYTHHQKRYNEEMSRLFRELVLADGRRIDNMKSILVDYFLAEKAKAVNCVKMLESSLEYIKSIDREQDVNEFIHRGEFLIADMETKATKVTSSTNSTDNNNNNNNNNNNKNTTTAATTTTTTTTTAPASQLALGMPDSSDIKTNEYLSSLPTTTSPHLKNIFDIGIHEFSKKTREISNMIYKDVVRWGILQRPGRIIAANWKSAFVVITKFGFLHVFNTKQDLKPMTSIELSQVDIEMKKDESNRKTQLYTFEIIVPNTNYWSLTGNPSRYLFKCESFEECIDWVVQAKKFILK